MFWAKLYLFVLISVSLAGFAIDAGKRRTWPQFAINILTVAAPALMVVAYLEPGLFTFQASLIALFGVTIGSNWISGRLYLREMNEEAPDEEETNFWVMLVGLILLLAPAFWFGMKAYVRMG